MTRLLPLELKWAEGGWLLVEEEGGPRTQTGLCSRVQCLTTGCNTQSEHPPRGGLGSVVCLDNSNAPSHSQGEGGEADEAMSCGTSGAKSEVHRSRFGSSTRPPLIRAILLGSGGELVRDCQGCP